MLPGVGPPWSGGTERSAWVHTRLNYRAKTPFWLMLAPEGVSTRTPPGLEKPYDSEPCLLSGHSLYLAKHSSSPPQTLPERTSPATPWPFAGLEEPHAWEREIGAWRLREVWGTAGAWALQSAPASVSPASRYTSCQLGRSVGGTELLHRFIRQNPRSRGGGNLITEINCPFPGSVYSWGWSSCRTPRGNPRWAATIDQMGAEAWGPEQGGDPSPQARLPSPLAMLQGWGLWEGAGTS